MKYEINLPVLEAPGYPASIFVEKSSAIDHKLALATIARYFKSEFRYDYLQYDESDVDPTCVGMLVCERASDLVKHEEHFPSYVIGACCFRKNAAGEDFLDWIWLHPFARNRGKLKELWPQLKMHFGNFFLSAPVSAHMEAFIAKHAPDTKAK